MVKNHIKKVITILQASKGYEEYSKEIHSEINQLEKISFHKIIKAFYPDDVVAKSTTEPENSNDLSVANTSTPFYYRAFFVRSIRTPKENALSVLLSMVGRIGQRLIVGCFPCVAVFHPDTSYRQAWKLAVVPEKHHMELSKMLYTFLFIHSRLRISVFANSLTEAYSRLPTSNIKPLLIARKSAKGGAYA